MILSPSGWAGGRRYLLERVNPPYDRQGQPASPKSQLPRYVVLRYGDQSRYVHLQPGQTKSVDSCTSVTLFKDQQVRITTRQAIISHWAKVPYLNVETLLGRLDVVRGADQKMTIGIPASLGGVRSGPKGRLPAGVQPLADPLPGGRHQIEFLIPRGNYVRKNLGRFWRGNNPLRLVAEFQDGGLSALTTEAIAIPFGDIEPRLAKRLFR